MIVAEVTTVTTTRTRQLKEEKLVKKEVSKRNRNLHHVNNEGNLSRLLPFHHLHDQAHVAFKDAIVIFVFVDCFLTGVLRGHLFLHFARSAYGVNNNCLRNTLDDCQEKSQSRKQKERKIAELTKGNTNIAY